MARTHLDFDGFEETLFRLFADPPRELFRAEVEVTETLDVDSSVFWQPAGSDAATDVFEQCLHAVSDDEAADFTAKVALAELEDEQISRRRKSASSNLAAARTNSGTLTLFAFAHATFWELLKQQHFFQHCSAD